MKKLLTLIILLGVNSVCFSQIQILPYDQQVKCDVEQLDLLAPPKANSTCGDVAVVFTDIQFSGGCLGTVERSYVFTDACGNVSKAQVYISITDATPPTVEQPADISCKKNAIPPPTPVVTNDNSKEPVDIHYVETSLKNGLQREWKCTDRCGNSTTVVQKITFVK